MTIARASILAMVFGFGPASLAHAMTDPTRPPAGLAEPGIEAPARATPILQSVILGPGVRAAIIDGERVQVGGRFREAEVIRITETEVVLRESGRTEILKMYPDIEKKAMKMHAPAQAKAPTGRSRP